MTTDSSNNTFLRDGYLYINITGCTTATSNDVSTVLYDAYRRADEGNSRVPLAALCPTTPQAP